MSRNKIWFKAKRYGYGWYPSTWEGWLSLLIYITAVCLAGFIILEKLAPSENSPEYSTYVLLYVSIVIVMTLLLIALAYFKGEPAKWRWGEDKA